MQRLFSSIGREFALWIIWTIDWYVPQPKSRRGAIQRRSDTDYFWCWKRRRAVSASAEWYRIWVWFWTLRACLHPRGFCYCGEDIPFNGKIIKLSEVWMEASWFDGSSLSGSLLHMRLLQQWFRCNKVNAQESGQIILRMDPCISAMKWWF